MYNLHPPKWQIYTVLVIVFFSILYFLPSPERWLTFGLFAAILGPVAYGMLRAKPSVVYDGVVLDDIKIDYNYMHDFEPGNSYNSVCGYIPGVRDFDGTYKTDA